MTRINLVPVQELSDQHLIAEYRELPRVIKQSINVDNAPNEYCLGKGHMKWARKHLSFILNRYALLCEEMKCRGFKVNFSAGFLLQYALKNCDKSLMNNYNPTQKDICISRNRIQEKIKLKPNYYKWSNYVTKRYI